MLHRLVLWSVCFINSKTGRYSTIWDRKGWLFSHYSCARIWSLTIMHTKILCKTILIDTGINFVLGIRFTTVYLKSFVWSRSWLKPSIYIYRLKELSLCHKLWFSNPNIFRTHKLAKKNFGAPLKIEQKSANFQFFIYYHISRFTYQKWNIFLGRLSIRVLSVIKK